MQIVNKFATTIPIDLQEVPILSPNYQVLGSVYEVIQAIPYPAKGTRGIYYYGYWKSLEEKLKIKAFAGSKDLTLGGHENESADFYTVGMKIIGDEQSGTAYLRIAIPSTDMNGNSNEGLIRALKMGGVEFSIVADSTIETINGQVGFHREFAHPRNDLAGTGAMHQSVYANKKNKLVELARQGRFVNNKQSEDLISEGNINLVAIRKMKPADDPVRIQVLSLFDNYKKKNSVETKKENVISIITSQKNKLEEEQMELTKEQLEAIVAEATTKALEDKQKQDEEANNKKKNSLSQETQSALRQIAIDAELDVDVEAPIEEIAKAILKAVEADAEALAETEANKFAGRKYLKNSEGKEELDPVYEVAYEDFRQGGNKILNKSWRENKHKSLSNKTSIRKLKEVNANPYNSQNNKEVVY